MIGVFFKIRNADVKKLINIVWPNLEGDASIYDKFLDNETEIGEGNIDASVNYAIFMYENQKARISTIESKSSIYLGFFGTVVAILSFALKDIIFLDQKDVINYKVDCMTMAHEFTKRIVGVLFLVAASLIVLSVYKYVSLIPSLAIDVSGFSLDLRWSDGLLF